MNLGGNGRQKVSANMTNTKIQTAGQGELSYWSEIDVYWTCTVVNQRYFLLCGYKTAWSAQTPHICWFIIAAANDRKHYRTALFRGRADRASFTLWRTIRAKWRLNKRNSSIIKTSAKLTRCDMLTRACIQTKVLFSPIKPHACMHDSNVFFKHIKAHKQSFWSHKH